MFFGVRVPTAAYRSVQQFEQLLMDSSLMSASSGRSLAFVSFSVGVAGESLVGSSGRSLRLGGGGEW